MSFSAARPLDSAVTVESPEGIEFTLFPAGPLIRGCAWAVDQIVQWVLIIIISTASAFFEGEGGAWMLLLLFFCIDWFYHTLWEIFCRGQSPGKLLLGIRVLRGDGSPVNPGASFLRNLLRFADTFLFLCPIALVTMLAGRSFRRLGDWIADTLVVYTAQSLAVLSFPGAGAMEKAAGVPSGLPAGGALSGEEKQGILMFARRYPLLGRARAGEIAAPLAEALRGNGGGPEDPPEESPLDSGGAADYLLDIGKRFLGD
jgi:uncharacterized RDD family membrane protein YckC